jgi:hypothetical protein
VKTGVQSIAKVLKTLNSGFRRNDVKKNEINFFTPSGRVRVGVIKAHIFSSFHLHPPHSLPLPQGEREFPDGNYLIFLCDLGALCGKNSYSFANSAAF